jgi:cytochrome c
MLLRTTAVLVGMLLSAQPLAAQDAEKGKSQFGQCRACHTVEKGQNRVGPSLFGILGRKAASVEKFSYSSIMKDAAAKGLIWDEKNMFEYLADPSGFLKKFTSKEASDNKMPNKFPNEELRKNVIAYLATIK